ncbi:hypothetical protein CLU79DRAFT_200770 [Phycomyces nitens]|nr:hypothetical protein CLU79DRAFT_200770 [Phycomyces nitens]
MIPNSTPFNTPYTNLDNNKAGLVHRPWSINQANSRLEPNTLQAALANDLSYQQFAEKDRSIPLNDLSSTQNRQSNNPYNQTDNHAIPATIHHGLKHKTYGYTDPFAAAPMEAWQEMKDYNLKVNGLPTLDQMMRLNTLSPLTLSHFSTFLRRRDVHQNLSFLLELETHDKLWRAHLSSVERKQGIRHSRFLLHAQKTSFRSNDPPVLEDEHEIEMESARVQNQDASLSRHDLVQNSTRIYRTFCSAMDAAQPIHLPEDHRLALEELIEKHHRPEPVVFESARSHVFEILNVFYYPQFVDSVLYTNIAIVSARILMFTGVLFLTMAYALEFALIFLDKGTQTTRWWGILPFLVGWTGLIASVTEFAWWLAFSGKCEIRFMVYSEVLDNSIRQMHTKRGCFWLILSVAVAFLNTLIFAFIPAHRLTA